MADLGAEAVVVGAHMDQVVEEEVARGGGYGDAT